MKVTNHNRYGAAVPQDESGIDHLNWNGWKAVHPWGLFEVHLFSRDTRKGYELWFIPGGKGQYHQELAKGRRSAEECKTIAARWVETCLDPTA
ncbi:MAG TPA: hypothetical protein VH164_03080 [Ktedonobacteraceae bacterium]|jgi:hypothetical protein|nr:hypothetical protein [Ktedonobacteraceae bacterium]